MQITVKVRADSIQRALQKAASQYGKRKVEHTLSAIALEFLARTKDLAPVGKYGGGGLQGSGTMQRIKNGYRVGYTQVYATVQDWPFKSTMVRVKPRKAKILYIPISARGARKPAGAKPVGLIMGGIVNVAGPTPKSRRATGGPSKKKADYILAKEARIKVKAYGNERGPNRYFSQTFKLFVPKTMKRIGQLIPTLFR